LFVIVRLFANACCADDAWIIYFISFLQKHFIFSPAICFCQTLTIEPVPRRKYPITNFPGYPNQLTKHAQKATGINHAGSTFCNKKECLLGIMENV
jgi:hypothetical protein